MMALPMNAHHPKRLIFTPELMQLVKPERRHSSPLLHRLALIDGIEGDALRDQIERAASAVPADKQKRVLTPIAGKSSSDDQVQDALGTLFLAKTLEDLGWKVEHEPEEAGGTPDLRIRKGDAVYLVEVRRVPGPLQDLFGRGISRLRDALSEIKTRTPIYVSTAQIGGQSSLKPFVKYITAFLATPGRTGTHVFNQDDVHISFQVGPELGYETSALSGWSGGGMVWGQGLDDIRAAIHEKLGKYKVPLIVALDLIGAGNK